MTRKEAAKKLSTSVALVLRGNMREFDEALSIAIKTLQDVPDTNVGEWIPCSERLPDKSGMYWVTIIWSNKPMTIMGAYDAVHKKWGRQAYNPIAWMPKPEPYNGVK